MPDEMMDDVPPGHAIAIVGAGVMGIGISVLALAHGVPVTLVDVGPEQLDRARERVEQELRLAGLMGAAPDRPAGRLITSDSIEAVAGASVVIEAITETAVAKQKVLCAVAEVADPRVPVITNTSSIPIDELAGALPDPAQLIGIHFMNPPFLIRTVEVIRGVRTGATTMSAVRELLALLCREAIVVNDAPGFVTSRLLHPMINTAAAVVQAGTASAAEVDALMSGGLGHPTGPLRTADLIGLDNLVDSLLVLHERTGDDACRPCDLLLDKVRSGELGRKSGRGFYEYEGVLS
jgi:methoxymalonate biosynthesis protein